MRDNINKGAHLHHWDDCKSWHYTSWGPLTIYHQEIMCWHITIAVPSKSKNTENKFFIILLSPTTWSIKQTHSADVVTSQISHITSHISESWTYLNPISARRWEHQRKWRLSSSATCTKSAKNCRSSSSLAPENLTTVSQARSIAFNSICAKLCRACALGVRIVPEGGGIFLGWTCKSPCQINIPIIPSYTIDWRTNLFWQRLCFQALNTVTVGSQHTGKTLTAWTLFLRCFRTLIWARK